MNTNTTILNTVLPGNALHRMKDIADNSVDCCITSPPYWGLRDYGTADWEGGDENCNHKRDTKNANPDWRIQTRGKVDNGSGDAIFKEVCGKCGAVRIDEQIGLEKTPEEYVKKIVQIFEEVKRILKPTGIAWLNLGDSYASSKSRYSTKAQTIEGGGEIEGKYGAMHNGAKPDLYYHPVLKEKDLVGIPWRCAFALQEAGWYLRQDIIWSKPNPMPESVTDRCTKAHEYIFLLAKNAETFWWVHRDSRQSVEKQPKPDYRWMIKETGEEFMDRPEDFHNKNKWQRINLWQGRDYYFDQQAILEPANFDGRKDTFMKGSLKYENGFSPSDANPNSNHVKGHERWSNKIVGRTETKMEGTGYGGDGSGLHGWHSGYFDKDGTPRFNMKDGMPARNKRSVWTVTTQPFAKAHFATFPEELIEPMILAGTSEHGCCSACGKPYERVIEKKYVKHENWFGDKQAVRNSRGEAGNSYNECVATATKGWLPCCTCNAPVVPAVVIDIFNGAGTTSVVAKKKGRDFIGIELNPAYIKIHNERMHDEFGLFYEQPITQS